MKKIAMIVASALAFGAFADDSYLYWLVGDEIEMDGKTYSYDTLTARVVAYDGDNTIEVMNLYGVSTSGGLVPVTAGTSITVENGDNSPYYAGITSGIQSSNWSYFIELYNDSNVFVGRSEGDGLNYATAQSSDYLRTSGFTKPGGTWAVTAFTAKPVPEPTSGLMLLLGSALLALRRKRA